MITFKIDNSKAVAKIRAFEGVVSDMTPVFRTVGAVLVRKINLCFKLGIDPFGSPWAKLKIRRGQPLRDTGRLQRSIVAKADAQGVTVGTNLRQARLHQFGGDVFPKNGKRLAFPGPGGRMIFAKKVSVPARPFMPIRPGATDVALPADWAISVTRALRDYLGKVKA